MHPNPSGTESCGSAISGACQGFSTTCGIEVLCKQNWFNAPDEEGNIVSLTDPENQSITFTYDNINRQTFRTYNEAIAKANAEIAELKKARERDQLISKARELSVFGKADDTASAVLSRIRRR